MISSNDDIAEREENQHSLHHANVQLLHQIYHMPSTNNSNARSDESRRILKTDPVDHVVFFLSCSEVMHYGRDLHGGGTEGLWPCWWSLWRCAGQLCGCTWPLWTVTSQKHWLANASLFLSSPESTTSSALKTMRTTNVIQVRLRSVHSTVSGYQLTPVCCVNMIRTKYSQAYLINTM